MALDTPIRKAGTRRASPGALAALLAALLAAACETPGTVVHMADYDYRQRHPIMIAEDPEVLDIPVGMKAGELSPQIARAIRGFAADWRRNGTGAVTIQVPSASANEVAAAEAAHHARHILLRSGVPASHIRVAPYHYGDFGGVAPIIATATERGMPLRAVPGCLLIPPMNATPPRREVQQRRGHIGQRHAQAHFREDQGIRSNPRAVVEHRLHTAGDRDVGCDHRPAIDRIRGVPQRQVEDLGRSLVVEANDLLVVVRVEPAIANVLGDRHGEEKRILRHERHLRTNPLGRELLDVDAVETHRTVGFCALGDDEGSISGDLVAAMRYATAAGADSPAACPISA